jgi:murein DD-endopeptidase MepM/ murein hydrolase activator NlpD
MPSPAPKMKVTNPYGKPNPIYKAGRHTGVDFGCPIGTPIVATTGGVVDRAGNDKAYGLYVRVMSNDNVAVYYCHLSKITVRINERVRTGHQVGLSGNTGMSTGPHLHYEERVRPYQYGNDRLPEYLDGVRGIDGRPKQPAKKTTKKAAKPSTKA